MNIGKESEAIYVEPLEASKPVDETTEPEPEKPKPEEELVPVAVTAA